MIYICHKCTRPTFILSQFDIQVPGVPFGESVSSISDKSVADLYNEARRCCQVNSYTATVLCCRKMLMNIAVSKGAEKDKSFKFYVDYLSSEGYIPPDGKAWVDHIREKGNEANHDIQIMSQNDAEELLSFIEMLLKFIYEFPAKIIDKDKTNPPPVYSTPPVMNNDE